jgi:hypothetical protein
VPARDGMFEGVQWATGGGLRRSVYTRSRALDRGTRPPARRN